MKNNPPTPSIKPPTSCCHQVVQKPKPYLKSFKQLRPKIHQPKNYPISITKSTFDPLKASFTITQSPETQLNKIDSGAKEKKKKRNGEQQKTVRKMRNRTWELKVASMTWSQWWWVVPKRVEPVMDGREGLTVGWVVEKTEKAWDDKERQCIESRDRESANKCKIFFHYFKV